jgi:hypothetical protein
MLILIYRNESGNKNIQMLLEMQVVFIVEWGRSAKHTCGR